MADKTGKSMGRNRQKPELIFEPLDHSHLLVIKNWFSDPDTKRWVEEPSDRLVSYINSEPQYYAWVAVQESETVGLVLCEIEKEVGSVYLVVNPGSRRRGYGRRILHLLKRRPEIARASALIAEIDPKNVASLACFKSVGFSEKSEIPSEEGLVCLTCRLGQESCKKI